MPMIPYPCPVKALHQINRHQVERGPRLRIVNGDTLTEIFVGYPSLKDVAEALRGVEIPVFKGFPEQRRPADG